MHDESVAKAVKQKTNKMLPYKAMAVANVVEKVMKIMTDNLRFTINLPEANITLDIVKQILNSEVNENEL